jgi:hypothetical protein
VRERKGFFLAVRHAAVLKWGGVLTAGFVVTISLLDCRGSYSCDEAHLKGKRFIACPYLTRKTSC